MIELLNIGIDNAIAMRISGKVTEADMTLVLNKMREKIEKYGNIVIYKELDSFNGVEIAALVEEFKYLFDAGIPDISKAVLVTDKKWLKTLVSIDDKIFKNIEIKYFPTEEKESAIEFLKNT